MSVKYASGKHAFGFCDRCGFRYALADLKKEMENGNFNGLRVCIECKDQDHPQLRLGTFQINDPQALRDPRPDTGEDASRRFFGWRPVGHSSLKATGAVGTVTVTTR